MYPPENRSSLLNLKDICSGDISNHRWKVGAVLVTFTALLLRCISHKASLGLFFSE